MKNFINKMKEEDGFTLVELMIVVAIIGVLSAVAVPNFKKYQTKAKTSEAKVQLAAAYTAQQSFYGDFNTYHACLVYMGYNPAPEAASRYYTIGFGGTITLTDPTAIAVSNGAGTSCPATQIDGFVGGRKVSGVTAQPTAAQLDTLTTTTGATSPAPAGTNVESDGSGFVIGAAGGISSDFPDVAAAGGDQVSAFVINENKLLNVIANGY